MSVIVEIRELSAFFPRRKRWFWEKRSALQAVKDVSLRLERGKTLGLVGESGCGKTTLGKSLLGLIQQTRGSIHYFPANGEAPIDLLDPPPRQLRELRKKIQIIFQDPYSSLNPRFTVRDILTEGMRIHAMVPSVRRMNELAGRLLDDVGLPQSALEKYPHEFSGGQRQRIGVARALALNPEFIVCDEAVSALDVSVQAQILNLLLKLQRDHGLTYLFISHDLSVVRHLSDETAIMYLGRIVEYGPTSRIYENPLHPYTRALLSAIPGSGRDRIILKGDVPSPLFPPDGCPFHPRCPEARPECSWWKRKVSAVDGREVACLLHE